MNNAGGEPSGWRISIVADNVIFLVGFGDWDEHAAQGFCSEYKQLVEKFGSRTWAVMGDATDWGLDDVQVQKIIRDQNQWIVSHGCRSACFYTGPRALNRLLLYRLAEPDSEDYRFRVYPYRGKAVEALGSSGYSVSDKQIDSFFREEGKRN